MGRGGVTPVEDPSIDEITDAWELQLTGNCGKVLVYP